MEHALPMPTTFTGLVEFAPTFVPQAEISQVLFDFDGTLSLVRQGWPEVMVPMFVEYLPRLEGESEQQVRQMAFGDIMQLNGKQTIYQMIQLVERIEQRGGQPREPLWYKHEYLNRLEEKIHDRKQDLAAGRLTPDDLLVHGARRCLELLAERGFTLYLASGTDEQFVLEEARLLEIDHFFGDRIHGAVDRFEDFSKQKVIENILRENQIEGNQLLSFGDGYVEIENTKTAGGLAVALATDEANNGAGRFDDWKHERLLGVGADCVIPDFRDIDPLLSVLLGETPQQ